MPEQNSRNFRDFKDPYPARTYLACLACLYSPTTELPDPKAQIQGCSAGTVKLAKPHWDSTYCPKKPIFARLTNNNSRNNWDNGYASVPGVSRKKPDKVCRLLNLSGTLNDNGVIAQNTIMLCQVSQAFIARLWVICGSFIVYFRA